VAEGCANGDKEFGRRVGEAGCNVSVDISGKIAGPKDLHEKLCNYDFTILFTIDLTSSITGYMLLGFVPERHASARATPSFTGLSAASLASSHAKKMNRNCDTAHERRLRALLWRRGLRYRKNVRLLPGKPDIVFSTARVAIFCDGDFWHGRDWKQLSRKLRAGTNASYWIAKIKANRSRDRRNARLLEREGWAVIRIWETDIHNDPERTVQAIEELLHRNKQRRNAVH
jgi:DNA mismatch endonuclease, patch repair protein